ncbi:MAG: S9 family peptidase [Bacteroidaceae bacterium]|nr:S9 family peptidase [Bacteroidaceae bacterium]MBP3613670.1 S9 family peptidase [Bacteroidaceae bacterium]
MKRHSIIMAAMLMAGAAVTSCSDGNDKATAPIIGKKQMTIENRRLTPEALWAMGRVGAVSVSPDAQSVVYGVSYYSVEQNKSHHTLHIMNADGSNQRLLTTTAANETSAAWIKGGTKIAFLSNEGGSNQVWEMNPDGSGRKQLSNEESDIEGFLFSPDETKVILVKRIKIKETTADVHPDLPLAKGFVVNDLMYKHWDEWITDAPHPFVATFDGNAIATDGKDLLEGTAYDCPNRPFGGTEQLAWSQDSKKLAYACNKKTGRDYSVSTDTDIYLFDFESNETQNLCKLDDARSNYGYDTAPTFSPDGNYLAWLSMKRDGYESDQNRLCIMNLKSGEQKYISEKPFDSNVDSYCWANDGTSLYFTGVWHGASMVYNINLNGELQQLTSGDYDYTSIATLGSKLIATRQSMSSATEIFAMEPTANATVTQLTQENKHLYDQMDFGKVEARWCTTTDGKQLHSWVIYPPHFDPNKKYPTLLFCEGGPQSPVSQFWSFRWNFQIMAANDYIIIAPNRRGLPGFGLEWNEKISGDYGGQCMQDLFAAIDDLCKEPYVDTDRLGCVGASFGGFTAMWMAGHHEKRFKAFIAHDGFFNMEQQYFETEESWFTNWDLGGAPHEKNAKTQHSYANSPHKFVDKWDTPILLIHGDLDYRILSSQSMAAFNAAKLKGVPAQLLLFPDENHWVLKPQNGILWQRTFFAWLDKWVKGAK